MMFENEEGNDEIDCCEVEEETSEDNELYEFSEGKKVEYKPIYQYIKRNVDLSSYLETEVGCNLKWYESGVKAACICPMPFHKENQQSFNIIRFETGIWAYNCFGCNSHGSVINFFKDYYGLKDEEEAATHICKRFGFKSDICVPITEIRRRSNVLKKIEQMNVVISNQCRMLLRKDFNLYNRFVTECYKRLNNALDSSDIEEVEKIGLEVWGKMKKK